MLKIAIGKSPESVGYHQRFFTEFFSIEIHLTTGRMSGLRSTWARGFGSPCSGYWALVTLWLLCYSSSSVSGDTPRRCIHQKFTLTSLSSLLFYLFHLLFRLKTL